MPESNPIDFPVSQLCKVTLVFEGGHSPEYMMQADQVDTFIEASKELHFFPGINPHNGAKTSELREIYVAKMRPFTATRTDFLSHPKAYWHTTPGLGVKMSNAEIQNKGAQIVSFATRDRVWCHSSVAEEERLAYSAALLGQMR